MENPICLDSDILIDILRGKTEAVRWMEENKNNYYFFTTIINIYEIYFGAYKSENTDEVIKSIEALTKEIFILDFNFDCSIQSARIGASLEKQGKIIDERDLFIGVIALFNDIPLKTNNKQHFSRIEGLKII